MNSNNGNNACYGSFQSNSDLAYQNKTYIQNVSCYDNNQVVDCNAMKRIVNSPNNTSVCLPDTRFRPPCISDVKNNNDCGHN